jgi:hypothetical protein
VAVGEVFNINNEAPVVYSLDDGEMSNFNQCDYSK